MGCTRKFLQSGEHPPPLYTRSCAKRGARRQLAKPPSPTAASFGRLYHAAQTITRLKDDRGQVQHYVCVSKCDGSRRLPTREARQQAHHDALTGLLQIAARVKTVPALPRAAQTGRARAMPSSWQTLIKFKQINDRWGHRSRRPGAAALRTAAQHGRAQR